MFRRLSLILKIMGKLFEYPDAKSVAVCGDIHGDFHTLAGKMQATFHHSISKIHKQSFINLCQLIFSSFLNNIFITIYCVLWRLCYHFLVHLQGESR